RLRSLHTYSNTARERIPESRYSQHVLPSSPEYDAHPGEPVRQRYRLDRSWACWCDAELPVLYDKIGSSLDSCLGSRWIRDHLLWDGLGTHGVWSGFGFRASGWPVGGVHGSVANRQGLQCRCIRSPHDKNQQPVRASSSKFVKNVGCHDRLVDAL